MRLNICMPHSGKRKRINFLSKFQIQPNEMDKEKDERTDREIKMFLISGYSYCHVYWIMLMKFDANA